ncbi:MAG: DnaJ domain-containing protein [Nitrospirae bacterium]|nr:DnaJ domain-containing protein [Candidatus Troglogloeales bacterium]
MSFPATVPLSGTLKDVSLSSLLHFLKIGRKTGILAVRHSSFLKSLSFQNGEILFATSNYSDDDLGEMLLKAGKINFKQYELAEESVKTSGKTQGTILIAQGFIKPRDLFETLVLQMKEIVLSLFSWEDAAYSFKEAPLSQDEAIGISIDPDEMVQDGLARIFDWTRLTRCLPPLDSVLKKNPVQISNPLKRSSDSDWVFNLVDDQRSIRDILTLSSTKALSCAQILNVLITAEMLIPSVPIFQKTKETQKPGSRPLGVEVQKESKGKQENGVIEENGLVDDMPNEIQIKKIREVFAKIDSQNYYQILDLTPSAEKENVKRAYFKLAKRYHPDRYKGDELSEVKKEIEAIFIHLTRAYDTLSADEKRRDYDRSLESSPLPQRTDAQSVPDFLARAEAAIAENDLKNAIYFLEEAIRVSPKSPEKGAIYLRYGQVLSRVPGKLREAVDAFRRSGALDSFNAAPHVGLGLAYVRTGMIDNAKTAFQEALKRDSQNKTASAELAKLNIKK